MFWIFEILLPILGASLLGANLGFLLRQTRLADRQSPPTSCWDLGYLAASTL
jgi:hypothetical protein